MPNGNALTTPDSGDRIETHGPYQHGSGFIAANGASSLQLFDPNLPISVASPGPSGPSAKNVFASEFGARFVWLLAKPTKYEQPMAGHSGPWLATGHGKPWPATAVLRLPYPALAIQKDCHRRPI